LKFFVFFLFFLDYLLIVIGREGDIKVTSIGIVQS
jgi:hypothetical protein